MLLATGVLIKNKNIKKRKEGSRTQSGIWSNYVLKTKWKDFAPVLYCVLSSVFSSSNDMGKYVSLVLMLNYIKSNFLQWGFSNECLFLLPDVSY